MLTVQFGQCGNQLGQELFTKISEDIESKNCGLSYEASYDYSEASCERWFAGITKDGRRIARAILIDTERKVLDDIREKERGNSRWRFSRKNEICQMNGGGSGNNWSYGYFVKAKELESDVTEAVRKECEKADRLNGFLALLGTAGGTGSGVGSRIVEKLRDEYPTKTILGILVLPFAAGEVGTQNYNGLLSLGKFLNSSDAMILLENDQLLRIVTNSNGKLRNYTESRSLNDTNVVACEKILSIFQPIRGIRNDANFFARKVASHPAYKMATVRSTPPLKFSTKRVGPEMSCDAFETGSLKWQYHVKQLRYTLRSITGVSSNFEVMSNVSSSRMASSTRETNSESNHSVYRRSVSNLLITRGSTSEKNSPNSFRKDAEDVALCRQQLTDDSLYTSWSSELERFTHAHESRRFCERDKYVSLVTNNSQICDSLDRVVDGAWNCYTNAAFLHRYKQFGLEDDDFLRAFAKMESAIKLYRELDES